MNQDTTHAQRITDGRALARHAASGIIRLKPNNFVERPWGGLRMLAYKGCVPLPDQKQIAGMGIGEAFETAACPSDAESNAYPSVAQLADGSEILLQTLLSSAGPDILGQDVYERFHGEIPLLPKTLDIAELLSVQAHPPGNTELYYIIHADPGASIRLGFRHSIDAHSLRKELTQGRANQIALLKLLRDDINQHDLQSCLAPLFADRDGATSLALEKLRRWSKPSADLDTLGRLFEELKIEYWHVLDLMNEITVRTGQFIHNATPARILSSTGARPAAEVHALGNPEGREILMLEVRRPGVTFRAWDNVRFPMRDIDIDKTLSALNLGATSPEEFDVIPEPIADEPGVYRVLSSSAFVVDQLHPTRELPINVRSPRFETLHAIRGECRLTSPQGGETILASGQTAIVPAMLDEYRIESTEQSELLRIWIPITDSL